MPMALLVADSDWVVSDVLSSLTAGDWEIEVLENPGQAAAKVGEADPDVVIVDLQVKNMGGMAVVRDIRATVAADETPRLVMLLDRDADGFLAKRAGADAWVVKPFQAHELRLALSLTPAV
ncbi:MAG: response regulator [Acidimicrobiia bacterium]